jgi:hypothetical protein
MTSDSNWERRDEREYASRAQGRVEERRERIVEL